MKIKIRNFDRQYNAKQMSGGNGSSYVPSNQHQEMLDKLYEKFKSKKTNKNSGYEIGQIRLFKTGISGMVGWRQITSYQRVLTTSSGNVSVRCDDYSSSRYKYVGYAGVVDRSSHVYYNRNDMLSKYIYKGDSTTGRYDRKNDIYHINSYGGTNSDLNVAGGYQLYVMEYVGGNYYYDKVNDIEYGTPSDEGLETERQKKENVYKLKI